jgi:hypothetical protein
MVDYISIENPCGCCVLDYTALSTLAPSLGKEIDRPFYYITERGTYQQEVSTLDRGRFRHFSILPSLEDEKFRDVARVLPSNAVLVVEKSLETRLLERLGIPSIGRLN